MATLALTRFLTPDEKAEEIASFTEYRADPAHFRTAHVKAKGGEGWIDLEALPLVDELNAIEGVCTIQSCCGHVNGHDYAYPGHFWIRLSADMMERFERDIDRLLSQDVIQHVTKLYSFQDGDSPHEVVDVKFWGEPAGRMDEAREVIAGFFRECSA